MKGVRLREIDKDYRQHMQAFLNFAVKAEKRTGKHKSKPVYRFFKSFYDYDKELKKALADDGEKKSRFAGVGKLLKKGGE